MTLVDLEGKTLPCHPKTIKMRLKGIIERLVVEVLVDTSVCTSKEIVVYTTACYCLFLVYSLHHDA